MAKMGRPRKAAEPMELTVSFRVTRVEYHWLHDLARKRGRSVNDLLRSLTLVGMPRPAAESSPEGSE